MTVNIKDIKDGDIVFIERDEKVRLVVTINDRAALVGKGTYFPLQESGEITAVFRPRHNRALSQVFNGLDIEYFNERSGSSRWDDYEAVYSKKDELKEVTLEEVAKQFNVDVSKIRIKE